MHSLYSIALTALCGLAGGMVRALVGVAKAARAKRPIQARYLLLSLLTSAAIGVFACLVLLSDYRLALLAGYAGIDLLENLKKLVSATSITQ